VIKLPDTSFFKAAKKVIYCVELDTFPVHDILFTAFNLFDEFRVQAFFRRISFFSTRFFTAKLASTMNAFHMKILLSYRNIILLIGPSCGPTCKIISLQGGGRNILIKNWTANSAGGVSEEIDCNNLGRDKSISLLVKHLTNL
jgi:hypothetical protein